MPKINKYRGFSLVELSVVLVIIDILIGGVMMGRSLVDSSRRTGVIADWQKYTSATNSYYTKFGYWPGDDYDAATKWGNTAGDGNGQLGAQTSIEYMYFWQDLSLSGFITGTYNGTRGSVPFGAIANSYMTHYYNSSYPANQAFYITGTKPTVNVGYSGETPSYVLTSRAALAIDTKIDDGIYNSGTVLSTGCGGVAYTNASGTAACNLYYIYKK